MLQATLLEDVDRGAKAYREEAFGPVAILSKFTDWEAALVEVNDSKFGLQAGLFTRDLHKVLEAWDHLDVGGIVVNRSEEHTSELQSLMRSSYAVFCLKKK